MTYEECETNWERKRERETEWQLAQINSDNDTLYQSLPVDFPLYHVMLLAFEHNPDDKRAVRVQRLDIQTDRQTHLRVHQRTSSMQYVETISDLFLQRLFYLLANVTCLMPDKISTQCICICTGGVTVHIHKRTLKIKRVNITHLFLTSHTIWQCYFC